MHIQLGKKTFDAAMRYCQYVIDADPELGNQLMAESWGYKRIQDRMEVEPCHQQTAS